VYKATIDHCIEHGAFDPSTMGSVPNVGLMAQKAEEYGSHDKTFEVPADGEMRVVGADGTVIMRHKVHEGDIWRACQVKDAPIRDWVKLAVTRARNSNTPAVFWLDEKRPHDAQLISKVKSYLRDHDLSGLDIDIMAPAKAAKHSLERARNNQDTISVTGNVLRDYLTDLFPILELNTSAKMLSIVPLMAGGGVFETGAGGSAPKHVQQFEQEGHLRWDSLGEFFALAACLDHIGKSGHKNSQVLAETLDRATGRFLNDNRSPSRKVKEIDNRGSATWLATYWGEELLKDPAAASFSGEFKTFAQDLSSNASVIQQELLDCQGLPVDCGGYYRPEYAKVVPAMRASATLEKAFASIREEDVFAA
jgi:isocitrate dehydrogenase